jgi:RES domain-containing protein
MPTRSIEIDGARWNVFPSGYTTQYDADEFGVLFVSGTADKRVVRLTRYSPQGSHSREQSLAALTDADVRTLFAQSQPSFTSPEAGYAP